MIQNDDSTSPPPVSVMSLASIPLVKGKMWSTMPEGVDLLTLPLAVAEDTWQMATVLTARWQEGIDNDVPIWSPADRHPSVVRGLDHGHTVIFAEGILYLFQRVVFVPYKCRVIAQTPNGNLLSCSDQFVSAWDGTPIGANRDHVII